MDQKDILDKRVVQYMFKKYNAEKIVDLLGKMGEIDYFVLLPFKTCQLNYKRRDTDAVIRCTVRAFAMNNYTKIYVHVPDLIKMIFPTVRAYQYENLLDNNKRCQDISILDLTELWSPPCFRTTYFQSIPQEFTYFDDTVGMLVVTSILQQQLYQQK